MASHIERRKFLATLLGFKAVRLRREKDDVGFCQIGKEAICFAARFNAAMRRQSDLVD